VTQVKIPEVYKKMTTKPGVFFEIDSFINRAINYVITSVLSVNYEFALIILTLHH
jgi:hypothetical protein